MPLYRAELLAKKPLRYAALIHDVSQVLYLPFDYDDGSKARDRSGYNNHSTIYGATLATGKIGMSRRFDGVDDYVEVPYSESINPKNAVTIVGWAWLDAIESRRISGSKELHYRWIDFEAGTGKYHWHVGTGVGWIFATIQNWALPVNSWFHLAYVVNWVKGWAEVYLNAVKKSKTTFSAGAVAGNTNDLYVGTYKPAVLPWLGINDEVRIYNRALSQDEIRMLMYRRW